MIILEEIGHFNHKVVIIGPNHMAVNNTLIQVDNHYITTLQLTNGRYATVKVVLTPKYIEDFKIKDEQGD